ncbi:MAG: bifunctional metallophosphatase/5'-nucleotidase [Treponema sp.]|nr:bifunctional metallophosphatase/5'-nucleotidase [Candidatus Treponema equifaecale]
MKIKKIALFGLLSLFVLFSGCKRAVISDAVKIIYTNDVHSYINNQKKDVESVKTLLTYGKISALKKNLAAQGENVILVDAGDFSQGTIYGALDKGETCVKLMNAAGYQLATLGNHEFDYGMDILKKNLKMANFQALSCNFYSTETGKTILPAFKIINCGNKKVAFIGICTPESITSSTPKFFQNEKGEYIYGFHAAKDGSQLYEAVQKTIDEVKGKADYVIGLGHLGVDITSIPYTSREVIANTTGLDAFIDGHSHTRIPSEIVKDKNGNQVVLTQTGSYLSSIGLMSLENEKITTELIDEYEESDPAVDAIAEKWLENVQNELGEKIAENKNDLVVLDKENSKIWLVRKSETNLGDLTADAVYYHFNEVEKIDCDIAVANGGGIRADLKKGDVTYNEAKTLHPFGNVICLIEVSGQTVLDMLEWSCRFVGVTAKNGEEPTTGGFLQVAGMKFEIDAAVKSSLKDTENWEGSPSGEYKVKNVEIYNRKSGTYEKIDLNKKYALGGINYILRNGGSGYKMLEGEKLVKDYVGEDYLILAEYMKAFKPENGIPTICTENSPLKAYPDYLLNYENTYGSGRIVIKK